MNSSARANRSLDADRSTAPTEVLSRDEVLARLAAGTLTMAEYLPFARAAFREQFEAAA